MCIRDRSQGPDSCVKARKERKPSQRGEFGICLNPKKKERAAEPPRPTACLLYTSLGIPIVVLLIIVFLFNRTPQQETYKYSDILNYFESGQVTSYRLNLGTGEMVLTLNDEKKSTVGYVCLLYTSRCV